MKDRSSVGIKLAEDGGLRFPELLAEEFGLRAGAEVVLEKGRDEIRILRPVTHFARMYIEPFDFSPCTFCNSCEMAGNTVEDCFGNEEPTCGSSLWAQGTIQCSWLATVAYQRLDFLFLG